MKRRAFIVGVAGTQVLLYLGACGGRRGAPAPGAGIAITDLLPHDALAVGRAANRGAAPVDPGMRQPDLDLDALLSEAAGSPSASDPGAAAARLARARGRLAARIQQELRAGTLLSVDGWYLSATEVALCRLAADSADSAPT